MIKKQMYKFNSIIKRLNGRKVAKIDNVLMPEYLFSFPNGIYLSIEHDKRDQYLAIHLGRLFIFDDFMPRIIVLEKIEFYFETLINFKYNINHKKNYLEISLNNLEKIIKNYNQLIEDEKIKDSIMKEEERLKKFLIKDISFSNNIEEELKKD